MPPAIYRGMNGFFSRIFSTPNSSHLCRKTFFNCATRLLHYVFVCSRRKGRSYDLHGNDVKTFCRHQNLPPTCCRLKFIFSPLHQEQTDIFHFSHCVWVYELFTIFKSKQVTETPKLNIYLKNKNVYCW
jgi:hypothetical protein